MRPEVERYLRDSKNEYAEAAKVASKLSPSDAGYREAVDKMNSIKTGFMNLNKNLEAHLANRVEFIQDKDDLSGSLSGNDNIFLTSVYAGDYDGFKVTGGELEFLDKSTNKYRRNSEFPQYSLTDVIGADGVAKIFDTERNLGNKGLGWDPKRSGREVNRLFKKVGNQGVIDMAFDGFDEYDGNYIDTVVKEQIAPKMSMQDWLVSDQRDNLTTKEGFAPYKAGFQNFISDIVKDGYDEGKTVYDTRVGARNNNAGAQPLNKGFKIKNKYESKEVGNNIIYEIQNLGTARNPLDGMEYYWKGDGWYDGDNSKVADDTDQLTRDIFGIQDNRFNGLTPGTYIPTEDNTWENVYIGGDNSTSSKINETYGLNKNKNIMLVPYTEMGDYKNRNLETISDFGFEDSIFTNDMMAVNPITKEVYTGKDGKVARFVSRKSDRFTEDLARQELKQIQDLIRSAGINVPSGGGQPPVFNQEQPRR